MTPTIDESKHNYLIKVHFNHSTCKVEIFIIHTCFLTQHVLEPTKDNMF